MKFCRNGAAARLAEALESRLLFAAGDLDTQFFGDGILPLPSGTIVQAAHPVADDKTLVVSSMQGHVNPFVQRFTSSGNEDPTFGWLGYARQVYGVANPTASLVRTDGSILIAGRDDYWGYDAVIARLDAQGNADPTFGSNGIVTIPGVYTDVLAVTEQSDGKLLLFVRDANSSYKSALMRLNADGTLDNSFSGDGIFPDVLTGTGYTATPTFHWAGDVQIKTFADGDILLSVDAGFYGGGGTPMLYAFKPDGARDTTVNGNGVVRWTADYISNLSAVDVLPDETIVAAGYQYTYPTAQVHVWKFKLGATGVQFDPDFGPTTPTRGAPAGFRTDVSALDARPDGTILLVSRHDPMQDHYDEGISIARLTEEGLPDPTFGGGDGLVRHPTAGDDVARSATIAPDGSITAVATIAGAPASPYVAKFVGDGLDDTTSIGPVPTLGGIPPAAAETHAHFYVTFADPDGVNFNSISGAEIRLVGPSGSDVEYSYSGYSYGSGIESVSVSYRFAAPGGTWDPSDNGTYTVYVLPNRITDVLGNAARSGYLGTMVVNIPPPGQVSGKVFNDVDGDGIVDAGEAGYAGRTVYADLDQDWTLDAGEPTTTTNASGDYTLSNIPAGYRNIVGVAPNGFVPTAPSYSAKNLYVVGGSPGTANFGQKVGAPATGSISGNAFRDVDSDTVKDASEPVLAGVTVFIDQDNDERLDAVEPTVTTDADGGYSFSGISLPVQGATVRIGAVAPFGYVAHIFNTIATTTRYFGGGQPVSYSNVNFAFKTFDVTTPVTYRSPADAYVRDGTSAASNFGTDAQLHLKRNTGSTREIYLKFDISSLPSIANAKLRLWGRIDSSSQAPQVAVYPVSDSTWTEAGITWNNRPAAGTTALATTTVSTSNSKWYEWDISSYITAERAAGRANITLLVRSLANTDPYMIFNSDEAATNRPELVIRPAGTASVLPSWVAPGSIAIWDPQRNALDVRGPTTIVADPGTSNSPDINVMGDGSLMIATSAGRVVRFATMDISDQGRVTLASLGAGRTASNYRVLMLKGRIGGPALTFSGAGTLDLMDNAAVLDYSAQSTNPLYPGGVDNSVRRAYNGGDWLGAGITSSTAAQDPGFHLGVANNAALSEPFGSSGTGALFAGVDVPLASVLIKFTHRADLNLDGQVNFSDASIFGTNYQEGALANWSMGDVDMDGTFTFSDAAIFGTYYSEYLPSV